MQNDETMLNFNTELDKIDDLWRLKTIAESDDHWFKIIKFEGEFEWHKHNEGKLLMIMHGNMRIEFRGLDTVTLIKGDTFFVPENLEHKPIADGVCGIMLVEKKD